MIKSNAMQAVYKVVANPVEDSFGWRNGIYTALQAVIYGRSCG